MPGTSVSKSFDALTRSESRSDAISGDVAARVAHAEKTAQNAPVRPCVHIGIDPGASGAVAWIIGEEYGATRFDEGEAEVRDTLEQLAAGSAFCYLERVHSMPGQGVASTFKFGRWYGFARGLLVALCIPFEEVAPTVWKRPLGLLNPKDTPTEKKRRAKDKANELFPDRRWTLKDADAVLIAEYGRRVRGGP